MSDIFDMTDIYRQQAEIERQVMESRLNQLRMEQIQFTINMAMELYCHQITALVYAGMNPNFCKPEAA